jgi:hypothetical protein
MRIPAVVGLGLLAATLHGCSSGSDVARSTTTTSSAPAVAPPPSTTTTTAPSVPGAAAVPEAPRRHHVRLGERVPRPPRITRQATRAHLEQALPARRPGYAYSPAELDQLTTKAMQIRVARQRLLRMRPEALETPRAAATRARVDALMADFAAKAGVPVAAVPEIVAMPTPPPRPRPGAQPAR